METPATSFLWFPLALTAALAFAGHNGLGKRALASCPPLTLAFGSHLFYMAITGGLLAVARYTGGGPVFVPRHGFWPALLTTSALNVLALLLLFTGIRRSSLSTSIPYLSLTPVFILLTGWVLLGERLRWPAMACILAVATGSWLLQAEPGSGGLTPFRKVLTDAGSRNLLAVALIFSVSAVVDKMALLRSDLLTFLFASSSARVLFLSALHLLPGTAPPGTLRTCFRDAFLVGILFAAEGLAHMSAIALGPVAYVVAVKRSSILFSALLGFWAFKEKKDPRIAGGILLMVGGAVLLSLL